MSEAVAAPVPQAQPAPTSDVQAPKVDAQPKAPETVDDPELDFGEIKLKKSEAAKRLKQQDEIVKGANKKFQEAAELRKQSAEAFELKELIGKDTVVALKKSGVTQEQLIRMAESVLADAIAEAQLSPEEREFRDTKAENERLRKEKEDRELSAKQQAEAAEVQRAEQWFDRAFADVIQRKGLDADAETYNALATKTEMYWGQGIDVSLDDIADEVSQEQDAKWAKRLQSWDGEQLTKRLGGRVEDVRKMFLAKAVESPPQAPRRDVESKQRNQKRKPLTEYELKQLVKQRIGQ